VRRLLLTLVLFAFAACETVPVTDRSQLLGEATNGGSASPAAFCRFTPRPRPGVTQIPGWMPEAPKDC